MPDGSGGKERFAAVPRSTAGYTTRCPGRIAPRPLSDGDGDVLPSTEVRNGTHRSQRRLPRSPIQTRAHVRSQENALRTDTQTIFIETSYRDAFPFLAAPENLPRWATGFAREIRRRGKEWVVTTPQGEIEMRYETDSSSGIVDYHMTPAPGAEVIAHSRLIPIGEGVLYVFTQVQPPGMSDQVFDGQVRTLTRELRLLKSLLEVGKCGQ